jgi:hypothetical protein
MLVIICYLIIGFNPVRAKNYFFVPVSHIFIKSEFSIFRFFRKVSQNSFANHKSSETLSKNSIRL